jgi:amino acid adenylation domain-containing protein
VTAQVDHGGPNDWPFEPLPPEAVDRPLIDLFRETAHRFADRLAVQDQARRLTYGELASEVEALAAAASFAAGARPGPVATLLPSDASAPIALLAAFAAGRGVVPLDVADPPERVRVIAENAEPSVLITTGALAPAARDLFAGDLPVVEVDGPRPPPASGALNGAGPDDLAYIIYTSGSTGRPKGVFQNQRGLLHDLMQLVNGMRISCDDRLAMVFPASVIAGLRSMFGALITGAELHMLPPNELGSAALARELRARGITLFRASGTLFGRLVQGLEPGERLDSLRMVALGNDRVDWSHVDAFRRICRDDALFACHAGATECSTLFVEWIVEEAARSEGARLPVGRPFPERRVSLVDEQGRPVPDGEVGEFEVSSRYIAQGYWRDPERTAGAFRADPADPLARVYRTGDLGRRRPDGLYEFLGRRDHQIKLHGVRIELGEIEAALRACQGVLDGALVVRRGARDEARALAAYVQLRSGVTGLASRHLLAMLSQRLPAHMLPAAVFILDELPWLPGSKIDRMALERMDRQRGAASPDGVSDPLQRQVARVFERVLGVSGATAEDTVLSLGGDSLQSVDLVLHLERELGVPVSLEAFQQSQSIGELTQWISGQLPPGRPER